MRKPLFQKASSPAWISQSNDQLLERSLKDVYIPLKETGLQFYVEKLYTELERKGLKHFKPKCYFSDEWFVADGQTSIAIPFYLAHKKLAALEKYHLYEIEGGTPKWFMQLLRHECGHAIDNAYGLKRKKKRQKIFGKSSVPYDDYYIPKPYSKKYVVHLDTWYAQSHPDEDFAETFAVWLNPRGAWRKHYKDWKQAYKKLEYMDEIMHEIGYQRPKITSRAVDSPQQKITKTLKKHYQEKQAYYGLSFPKIYDVHLFKIFSNDPEHDGNMKASSFIKKVRKDVRRAVAPWTGTYQYNIVQLVDEIVEQAGDLGLHLRFGFDDTKNQFISMITLVALEYIHSGNHKKAR